MLNIICDQGKTLKLQCDTVSNPGKWLQLKAPNDGQDVEQPDFSYITGCKLLVLLILPIGSVFSILLISVFTFISFLLLIWIYFDVLFSLQIHVGLGQTASQCPLKRMLWFPGKANHNSSTWELNNMSAGSTQVKSVHQECYSFPK